MASFLEGGIVGLAVGEAGGAIVEPALEPTRQEAEKAVQARILELHQLAELVATALASVDAVTEDAQRNGYAPDQLRAAIQLALKAPPYSEVLDLWRRNATRPASEQISERQVDHALAKSGIEYQYWPALKELINARLSAQELALAVVRGLIPDAGILPVSPPTAPGSVPAFPTFDIDTLAEALASGFDKERFSVLVGSMGRPMPVNEAARATFRQLIQRVDFDRAIAEGDIRNEWRDALFDVAREILSPTQYAESFLRGYTPDIESMFANMAKHGMSRDDAELLFLNQGRPLNIHQITTGEARGGSYNGPTDQIPEAFLNAVRESNIKPPYYNLDYANRYSYPSAFFFRLLQTTGALSAAEAEQRYLELGWPPDLAHEIAQALAPKASAPQESAVVKSQRTAAITALRKAYVEGAYDRTTTDSFLSALDHDADDRAQILAIWDVMRGIAGTPIDTTGGTPH